MFTDFIIRAGITCYGRNCANSVTTRPVASRRARQSGMRTVREIEGVLWLAEMGLSRRQIAAVSSLPYNTVAKWLRGELPAYARHSGPGCEACGHPVRHRAALPGDAYAYLLGLYLGDGHIAPFPRTNCLRIYLDAAYPGLVGECVRAMGRVMPANRVNATRRAPANCVIVSAYSQAWPCLFPQHGPGAKHTRSILLEPWQRTITAAHPGALVRGLIHSDGSRFANPVTRRGRRYSYPRYFFANASADIRGIFCEHLDLLEVEWRPAGRRNISVARRASVARLDELVGPKR
jgi:hypothetical protein